MGYRDVLNTIHESHDYIPIRPSYILQLHRDLLQYAQESSEGSLKIRRIILVKPGQTAPSLCALRRWLPMKRRMR